MDEATEIDKQNTIYAGVKTKILHNNTRYININQRGLLRSFMS
jgi:hypothetical protein